ncbi:MAG: hypothetical protein GFH27_549287n19 [Chloroflexi bacterium AL-W]|nr:hypothetical protein [Chloroflexi bacterium AL-W]
MSIKPVSTMFAALHGEFTRHSWRDPVVAEIDAYSLFVARSSALGWLADTAEYGVGGVWGMNDAGQDSDDGAQLLHRVWFQVALNDPMAAGQPLPVQAFLACAGDVVARMGTLRLQGIQILLPVEALAPTLSGIDALRSLLVSAGWFADSDVRLCTQVWATMDGGQDLSIRTAAPGMFQQLQMIRQDVFVCDSFSFTDDAVVLQPAIRNELWSRPSQHRTTFHGTLVEWSLDTLGWLAAFLASVSSQHGVTIPLMLTVSRPEGATAPAN